MDKWASAALPERLPFSKKRLSKRVLFSYIADYLIIIVLIGLFAIIDKITPFHQPFSLENYTLHYPFATKERVPVFWAFVYAIISPMAIIGFYTMVIDGLFSHQTTVVPVRTGIKKLSGRYRFKDRLWELNCGWLGLGLSVGAAFVITGSLKSAIGKPRPDIISRCRIDESKINKGDGFKSFPSGHASVSFAGLFYLSLYLAGKLHVMDAKGEVWRGFIVMVPALGAALITGTRIMDARHHPFDVMFGSALGILCAWTAYRQYFPPVSETWRKGRAYPIRAWGQPTHQPATPSIMVEEYNRPPQGMKPIDEEHGEATGYVTSQGDANVFRKQISDSQRRRGGASSTSSYNRNETMDKTISSRGQDYHNQMPATNPYSTRRRGSNDNYDYSSSDNESGFELQHRIPQRAPQANQAYDPPLTVFSDTSYHPRGGLSSKLVPPPVNVTGQASVLSPTGDLGERKAEAPAPHPPQV